MQSRRDFLGQIAVATLALGPPPEPLSEFDYGDIELAPGVAQKQLEQTQKVLLALDENSLLKPWRLRAGLAAPGPDLGGWYDEVPLVKTESGGHGFAPAHSFGQWLSALARGYACTRNPAARAKLVRLLDQYEPAISPKFYKNFRFPAYNYDKMVIALTDAHRLAAVPNAAELLDRTTQAALPHLPPHALDRDAVQRAWRESVGEYAGDDYTWDESYTMGENLYLASKYGMGSRYREIAPRYLLNETFFDPLAAGENVLARHHAYSFCNSLSSAMQAYLSDGSTKHFVAARNAFRMIEAQSFATGAWGPNEAFGHAGGEELTESLTSTHRSFETPCGSYAHFKITRYLLRATADAHYGDSMERVLYNTVFGAKELQPDGHAFYYSDYNAAGRKTYHPDRWPCCSGTLPQVAADYRLLIYFRDRQGIYANLFLPSTVRFTSPEGVQGSLSQFGDYPESDSVTFRMTLKKPSRFALRLRVPEWSLNPSILLNGKPVNASMRSGFAQFDRQWRSGDQLQLRLDRPFRLVPISDKAQNVVAVMQGPLVMFLLGSDAWRGKAAELLAAVRSGSLDARPFYRIGEQPYRTYTTVAS